MTAATCIIPVALLAVALYVVYLQTSPMQAPRDEHGAYNPYEPARKDVK